MSRHDAVSSIPMTEEALPPYQQVYQTPQAHVQQQQQQQQRAHVCGSRSSRNDLGLMAQILPEREIEIQNNDGVEPERDEKPGIGDVPEEHLNMGFDALFHEHKSTKSIRMLYRAAGVTYNFIRIFVYHFLIIFVGFSLAFNFAIINGVLVFLHVWAIGPLMKIIIMWVYTAAPLVSAPIKAIWKPLVDASAHLFSQIKIKTSAEKNDSDGGVVQRQSV